MLQRVEAATFWAFAWSSILRDVACFTLTADESHKLISPSGKVEFLWHADVPLSVCQFKRIAGNSFYDLSTMPSTGTASYLGRGLKNGDCGMLLDNASKGFHYYAFGCRVRSSDGQWKYGQSVVDIVDDTWRNFAVDTGPSMILVKPGKDAIIAYTASEPLESCSFLIPGQEGWVSNSGSFYTIDNTQLNQGKCRLTFSRVTEKLNGFVTGQAKSANLINGKRGTSIQSTEIVVLSAPSPPILKITNQGETFQEGDFMNATCKVGSARPVARITWLLGNSIIKQDGDNDDVDIATWRWNFELQAMSQSVSFKLNSGDDGKDLVCRVFHVALPGGRAEARLRVSVGQSDGRPTTREKQYVTSSSRSLETDPEANYTWIVVGVVLCVAVVGAVVGVVGVIYRRRLLDYFRVRRGGGSASYRGVGQETVDKKNNVTAPRRREPDKETALYDDVGLHEHVSRDEPDSPVYLELY